MDPEAKNFHEIPLSSLSKIRSCLLAGPGRGDCEHYIGLPKYETYPETTDEYGVPHGWCIVCWHTAIIGRLHERLRVLGKTIQAERTQELKDAIVKLTHNGLLLAGFTQECDKALGKDGSPAVVVAMFKAIEEAEKLIK